MYLALYRKYRPTTFDDVISQPHITTTLKNQISGGKQGHAYLFTGSRGTGKTTCAKILSMAVNCLNPVNGNPCLECEACREIADGSAVDIVEMDAASNNGVNDVRMLRDEVAYTPVSCKYRVYIIDEVHMMSTAAFNALLKTLEEPPAHVIFILATTELHKVPATIVSRCQRFEFRRIDIADSADRLMAVAENENISLERDAAELISRLSDGGMRDALSVLDRCIAAGGNVTTEVVRSCAGVADNSHLYRFADMISHGDIAGCLNLLQELHNGSKDLARLVDELMGHYRDLMLYKTVPQKSNLLSALPEELPALEKLSSQYSLEDIFTCLDLLQKCSDSIGKTRHRKTAVEMTLIKMFRAIQYGTMKRSDELPPEKKLTSRTVMTNNAEVPQAPVSQPMGQEFAPLPDEKLSPEIAAIISKTRAISEGIVKSDQQANPAEAAPIKSTPEAPPQPEESIPEPPFEMEIPLPEPPPEEYAPQQEYSPVPEPQPAPIQPAVTPTQPAEEKPEELVPKPSKLPDITPAFWSSCVELLGGMMSSMLEDSTATVNSDGVLEIRSDNMLLHNMVNTNGYQSLENALGSVIGKSVRAILVEDNKEITAEEEISAVKLLLNKAKQLGIETEIKQ